MIIVVEIIYNYLVKCVIIFFLIFLILKLLFFFIYIFVISRNISDFMFYFL